VPDVPPIAETLPGFEFYVWQALIAPAGVAQSAMARLNTATVAALEHPDTKERLIGLGAEATPTTAKDADAHIRAEVERWIKVLKPVKPAGK
jgi:tripartite-type tricarboxylate transporter receptor subunit TctC